MDSDEIKALLEGLRTWPIDRPLDTYAYAVDEIEGAGADVDEVRAWAEVNGGLEVTERVRQGHSLRPDRLVARAPRRVRYVVVPICALQQGTE